MLNSISTTQIWVSETQKKAKLVNYVSQLLELYWNLKYNYVVNFNDQYMFNFTRENKHTKQERKDSWKELIDEFTKTLYPDLANSSSKEDLSIQDGVNAFMASMITPNSIKRSSDEEIYSKMLDEFSSLLYKYSIK